MKDMFFAVYVVPLRRAACHLAEAHALPALMWYRSFCLCSVYLFIYFLGGGILTP